MNWFLIPQYKLLWEFESIFKEIKAIKFYLASPEKL